MRTDAFAVAFPADNQRLTIGVLVLVNCAPIRVGPSPIQFGEASEWIP